MGKKPKTLEYVAKCKHCESVVYYYPSQLLLEGMRPESDKTDVIEVDGTCEVNGHKGIYVFPLEFKQVD